MNRVAATPVKSKVTWPLRLASWAGWAMLYVVLIFGAVIMAFPFYWMVTTAFKGLSESVAIPPTLWPTEWLWTNFTDAWHAAPFPRYFLNTVIMAVGSTLGTLITGSLAAYAFARMRFFGKDIIFMLFLATMMIPFEVTLIPDFLIIRTLRWYNTYTALIVPWTASVFSIFLLRQFFMTLPKELYEATILDGGSHFQFLYRVAIPLAIPALITVAIFSFLGSWNSLLWPLIVTSSPHLRPIQVGLSAFQSEAGSYYNLLMAGATLAILPIVILFLIAQKQFVEGIARSGIKG
jgi:multiple sugar transport system permease protein